MKKFAVFTSALAALTFTAVAQSASITINSIAADWFPTTLDDGTSAIYVNTDGVAGNEEIRWGTPVSGAGKSGYRFDSNGVPLATEIDSQFLLGDFTHFNFPVYAPSLNKGQLNISTNFTLDGGVNLNKTFSFLFNHDETSNVGSGNCCNDLISVSSLVTTDVFTIGSTTYTLSLLGFLQGGAVVNTFSTVENQANQASLVGVFTEHRPTEVPEPTPLLLLGLGLLSMFGCRKLKSKA